jgi:hypothetical protein
MCGVSPAIRHSIEPDAEKVSVTCLVNPDGPTVSVSAHPAVSQFSLNGFVQVHSLRQPDPEQRVTIDVRLTGQEWIDKPPARLDGFKPLFVLGFCATESAAANGERAPISAGWLHPARNAPRALAINRLPNIDAAKHIQISGHLIVLQDLDWLDLPATTLCFDCWPNVSQKQLTALAQISLPIKHGRSPG